MTLTASNIQHGFLALLTLSILAECLLTILHTHAAERAAHKVPPRFEGRLSPAAHIKAADYTGELAQGNLLAVFAGAGVALLMTYGQGLTLLASLAGALSSSALVGEWIVVGLVLFLMIIVDLPFAWFLRCRIPRRFGYLHENEGRWVAKHFKDALTGWLIELPFIALALTLFESIGRYWWVLLWAFWTLYLVWRWRLGPTWTLLHGRPSKPIRDAKTRSMVKDFLRLQGFGMRDLILMKRPSGWGHSHVVLAGFGRERTVVVFAHTAAKLTREELLALIAHDVGHAKHLHAWIRIILFSLAGLLVAWFAGWGARHDAFFEGFGFSPYVTLARDGAHAGFVIATALIVFPILFYPLRPLINLFSRAMQFDADAYAVENVSANALTSALVKLHRDWATTLTPSRLYSLFHYARPHAGMRVEAILARAKKNKWPLDKPAKALYPGAPGVFDISGYLEPGETQPVVMPVKQRTIEENAVEQPNTFFMTNEEEHKTQEARNEATMRGDLDASDGFSEPPAEPAPTEMDQAKEKQDVEESPADVDSKSAALSRDKEETSDGAQSTDNSASAKENTPTASRTPA